MRKVTFWLALAFVFTIPWETIINSPTLGSSAKLIGVAMAAVWGATVILTGRMRMPKPFHLLMLLFILWNAASIFWSSNPDRVVTQISTWAQLFIMALIFWDMFNTRRSIIAALQAYILGAYVVVINTLYNFITGASAYYGRFSAADTNPNDMAMILALGVPIAWFLADPKSRRSAPLWLKWVNYLYIPLALEAIALTGSRTAVIALIPGILFGLASYTRLRLWAKGLVFGFLILSIIFLLPIVPPASIARLSSTSTEISGGDLNGRTELWEQGMNAFMEHPLTGVGSNNFRSTNREGKVAHNSYLSTLVETGSVGFLLFVSIIGITLVQASRQSRWPRLFWLCILAVWAIGAFTLSWESHKQTWLFFCLVVSSGGLYDKKIVRDDEPIDSEIAPEPAEELPAAGLPAAGLPDPAQLSAQTPEAGLPAPNPLIPQTGIGFNGRRSKEQWNRG